MKFKKGIIKFAAIPILAIVAIVLFNYFSKEAEASFDPSTCITFKEYTASNEVESGVLFIGIYLINLNGLNDELYDQAMDSASSSGQDVIYYKSDLADGIWVNLEDASGFADISETATPVDEKELANLFVKYYVNKDGIMKDVTDGREVNPFNVINPYDLRNLPELDQLVQQYTGSDTEKYISEKNYIYKHKHSIDNDSLRSDVYNWRTVGVFFDLDLSDEETDKLDRQLDRLYEVYKSFKSQDKTEEADLVYSLMESVDAQRRTIVFDKLSQEYSALGELYDIAMGSLYTSYANFKTAENIEDDVEQPDYIIRMRNSVDHDFTETTKKERELKEDKDFTDWWIPIVPDEKIKKKSESSASDDEEEEEEEEEVERDAFSQDQTITGAIEACIESCQDSYSEYSAKALKDAESVMAHAIYEYSIKVIETATPDGLSEDATTLKHLYNIKDGTIKEGKAELEVLDTILEPRALAAYNTRSKDGPSGEYNAAKAANKSAAVLGNYLDTQKNKLETKRSDLQFVISARHERMQSSPAYEDTIKKIDEADAMKKAVPDTDFKTKAKQSVEDYIIWLQEELKRIKDGDKSLGSHLEELQDKKEDLQKEYKAALDDEDLALAKDLEAEIQAVDNDIQDELDLIAKKIENAESAGEIADLMAGLGNSLDGLINNLLNDAKGKISAGNTDDLGNIIDALSGVGATDALNDLKDALEEDGGASATLMNDLDNAIEDSLTNGMNAGDEEEEEKEDASSLSKDKLRAALTDFFGPESNWGEKEYAAVITALSRIQSSSAASDLAKEYLDKALALKNKYLYQKYKRNSRVEYVSLIPISDLTDYRYVYDGDKHEAILYKDLTTIAYEFEVGKKDALKGEQTLDLSTAGLLANGDIFYLAEEDTLKEFKCQAQYVVGREYAVCVTSQVDDLANGFLELFK